MMKPLFSFALTLVCISSSCNLKENKPEASPGDPIERVESTVIGQLLDGALVKGTILMYDAVEEVYYSNDFTLCDQGHLPASTFKIPNTLIALETVVVEGEETSFPWDGQRRDLKVWEQDLTLSQAFHYSCVPCYQEIARKIGSERMNEWLARFNYGAMVVTPENIDRFWLEGDSKISPFQQVDFLKRFYFEELPLSKDTYATMKNIMVVEGNEDWVLSGKTGWSIREGHNTGWFVGYLEKAGKVYFIATCIQPEEAFNMDMFNIIRRQISMEAFRILQIIE